MRLRWLVVPGVVLLLLLAACGSSSGNMTSSGTFDGHPVSKQAAEICAPEAAKDLQTDLVAKTTSTPKPGWANDDYTCSYQYARGASFLLSVRDLGTDARAAAYLTSLGHTLAKSPTPISFGTQGAFLTTNGNSVVQKDSHVLVVDVQGLPNGWSKPPLSRVDASEVIAAAIMDCWKGDS